jgi:hypothetical protein
MKKKVVFIGHGRSLVWLELRVFIHDRLHLNVEEFNRLATAGIATTNRLEEMLEIATFAFLVMTAEDEQRDGKVNARLNVIHEVGLFQGKLGFKKAIILLEEGCEEFSNIHGLGQIRFPKGDIQAKFEEIRQVLEREYIVQPSGADRALYRPNYMTSSSPERDQNARSSQENIPVTVTDICDLHIRFGNSQDAKQINEVAKNYFSKDLLLPMRELRAWLNCETYVFRVAELIPYNSRSVKVIGYYAILPLQSSAYNLLREQKISEISLGANHFMQSEDSRLEALYILDVARDPRFQVGAALLRDLCRQVGDLIERNPNRKEVGTWAFTEDGRKVVKRLGMRKIKDVANFPNTAFYGLGREEIEQQRQNSTGLFGKMLAEKFEASHAVRW